MEDRKARLKALAAKAGRDQKTDTAEGGGGDQQAAEEDTAPPYKSIKFRNYVPQDASLDKTTKQIEDEPEAKRPRTTEEDKTALQKALEEAKQEVQQQQEHAVLVDIAAPKKINWDLKRDIQPKLDKLERRTQRAIVSLLKERLEREAAAETADGEDEEEDLD